MAFARTTADWPRISPWLGRQDAADADLEAVRALLDRCGARAATEDLAHRYEHSAVERAAALGLDAPVAQLLALAVPAGHDQGEWAA